MDRQDDATPLQVHTLLCHKHLSMGLTCLGSLIRHCKDPISLAIHDDGSLTRYDINELYDTLRPNHIYSREEANDIVIPHIREHQNCCRYRKEHPLGIKLIDIPIISGESYAYCDADVLFLQDFKGLDRRNEPCEDLVFMRDGKDGYSITFYNRYISSSRIKLPDQINAGIMFVNYTAYNIDEIEMFLGRPEYYLNAFTVEQTCWAALARKVRSCYWNPGQVRIPDRSSSPGSGAIALHFISPVRSLLRGMSVNAKDENGEAIAELRTQPVTYTPFVSAIAKGVSRRLRRLTGPIRV